MNHNALIAIGIFLGVVLIANALPFILFRNGGKDFETYGKFFTALKNSGKPKTDEMDELHRRLEELEQDKK
jgi:hypothetical protein